MRSIVRTFSLALVLIAATAWSAHAAPAPVTFAAKDHVKVFATYYGTGNTSKPIVLLFHQAGANGAEYATIAPKLNALGFNALAVDQRSGGRTFGRMNKTVEALGRSTGYRAALPDLQAALDWRVRTTRARSSSAARATRQRWCSCWRRTIPARLPG